MSEVKYKIKVFSLTDNQIFVKMPTGLYNSNDWYEINNFLSFDRASFLDERIVNNYCCLPGIGTSIIRHTMPIEDYINSLLKHCKKLISEDIIEIQYSDLSEKLINVEKILFNVRNDISYYFVRNSDNYFKKAFIKSTIKEELEKGTLKAFNI